MDEIQTRRCIDAMNPMAIPKGKLLITEGEIGNELYVVCSGAFEVLKSPESGNEESNELKKTMSNQ